MKNLKNKKVVVIPDIHQCIRFVDEILKNENLYEVDDSTHIVFLGDYFDCFEKPDGVNYLTMFQMCQWINDTYEKLGDKATWLFGNHDMAYFATYPRARKDIFYSCSGYDIQKAYKFNEAISPEWVYSTQLCAQVGDYILSHAGFHIKQFKYTSLTEYENIVEMYNQWERDKKTFSNKAFHWIGHVGKCRGGMNTIGSPVWLDWDHEFEPIPGINQIVGHTNTFNEHRPKKGKKSLNYCIDYYRTRYCILENGNITFKDIIN